MGTARTLKWSEQFRGGAAEMGEKRQKQRTRRKRDLLAFSSLSSKDLLKIRRCPVASPNPGSLALHPETSPCPHQRCKKKKKRLSQLEILGTSLGWDLRDLSVLHPQQCPSYRWEHWDTGGRGETAQSCPNSAAQAERKGNSLRSCSTSWPCCPLNILS